MVYNLSGDGTVVAGLIVALYLLAVLVIGMAASSRDLGILCWNSGLRSSPVHSELVGEE